MWAHYAQNSGFVVGCNTQALSAVGVELRKVLYMELVPEYTPAKDNIIRLNFVEEERRKLKIRADDSSPVIPILEADVYLREIT